MPDAKPLFSPEQIIEDGQNRLARTMGQATVPGAVIIVLDFVQQRYLHQEPLPPAVIASLGIIGTAVTAWATLRKRLRGEA